MFWLFDRTCGTRLWYVFYRSAGAFFISLLKCANCGFHVFCNLVKCCLLALSVTDCVILKFSPVLGHLWKLTMSQEGGRCEHVLQNLYYENHISWRPCVNLEIIFKGYQNYIHIFKIEKKCLPKNSWVEKQCEKDENLMMTVKYWIYQFLM